MLLGVDVGGTFTDAVLALDGRLVTAKAPTTPERPVRGRDGRDRGGAREGRRERRRRSSEFSHGMTVATNALLEGRGARTAFVATEGFTDLIALGRQNRPQLYRLCAGAAGAARARRAALRRARADDPGRPADASSTDEAAGELADRVAEAEPEAVAVVAAALLPPPRARAGDRATRSRDALPDVHVSLSHEVVGTFREFERAATTEIDAALSPLLASYLRRLVDRAREAGLPEPAIMQSNGGLIDVAAAAGHASWTVLSGPAGGAAGAAFVARAGRRARTRSASTWAAPRATCAWSTTARCRSAERRGRRAAAGAADARRPHGRRGRRLDRLARRRRRAAGRAALGGRRSRAGVLRARRHRADRHRRQPGARLPVGRRAARRRRRARSRRRRGGGRATWPSELDLDVAACAEGILRVADAEMVRALRVVTVERGIDPRALRADGLRRRRPAARRADRRRARDRHDPLPARVGGAGRARAWSSRRAGATSSAACCWSGDALTAEAIAEHGGRARRARARGDARAGGRAARRLRAALPRASRSSSRSPAGAEATPEELRDGVRGRARGALRLPRRRAGARAGDDPRDRDRAGRRRRAGRRGRGLR